MRQEWKEVKGERMALSVCNSLCVVINKEKQLTVNEIMKKHFKLEDYYFTQTNRPLGVLTPTWLDEVMEVLE